jgi:ribonuclease HI
MYEKVQQERRKEDLKEISIAVDQRCEAIQGELKHMISSLLERSSKKVVIDRITKTNKGDIILLNQEKEVLNEVRSHFQNQFRKRNTQDIKASSRWNKIYSPLEKIKKEMYMGVENDISDEEWIDALKNTKAKSAPGPSGISYPLIKKVGIRARSIFKHLANMCIQEGDIPTKWKFSQLYPIPKGEDWNYNLSNVRPIVLIETFRKTVVRILTHRLDKILVEHNMLEGPNFAGLSGDSTASPVHIMNNIIEDARQKKNELWILFQDMRKAFDSVSLRILRKALERIKMPEYTIRFILSLYESRKIKVITSFGLTKEFEAEDGIDQGEVISPLVWRIFYDPLLCAIQSTKNLGYKMSTHWPIDIVHNKIKEIYHQQGVLAYADDTTWLARSKEEMQKIVDIANEFYEINDIEINSKKSELVVINYIRGKKEDKAELAITVGKNKEKVFAKKDSDPVRHLGVWISGKGKQKCSLDIIRNEVNRMCKAIKWKKASASQLVYLNNSVLLPSIEYRLQTIFLSKTKCDSLQRPIWILIKNKLDMASTTANSICSHIGFLGLRSIWQNQLAHHFTELTIRINQQETLGKTTRLRIKEGQLQSKYLSSPLSENFNFNKPVPKHNLAMKILHETAKLGLKINEITEDPNTFKITGTDIMKLLTKKDACSFAESDNANLYLLEQLIDSTGKVLLSWQQIKHIRKIKKRGRTPNWFTRLEEKILKNSSSREVQDQYKIKKPNRWAIKAQPQKISKDRRKREWILFKKNEDRRIYVGKVLKKTEKGVVAEHWQRIANSEEAREIFLRCEKCDLSKFNNSTCLVNIKFSEWHQVVEVWKKESEIEIKAPISTYIEEKEVIKEHRPSQEIRVEITASNIESAIIQRVTEYGKARKELLKIQEKLKEEKVIEYYTDGAMKGGNESENSNKMGLGWVVKIEENAEDSISFSSSIENWPSSTRAELGAIWTALLTAPCEAQTHIFTDSKAAIEAIESHQENSKLRNWFKTKNRSIIRQIKDCCIAKNLDLVLHKVKGHSGNKWNDIADKLAKEGINETNPIKVPETTLNNLLVIPKWKNQIIDSPLRSFVNITTAITYETEWAELSKMAEIIPHNQNTSISDKPYWKNTWEILKKMQGKKCISLKKSKALIFRIKCINNILPTKEICFQRNPKLYKSQRCIACYKENETFYHIAECEVYQKIWKNLEEETLQLTRLKVLSKLDILLEEKPLNEALYGKDYEAKMHNRKLHLRGFTNIRQLTDISKITGSKKKASRVLNIFTENFWECFHERLWKFRCEVMVEWEKENNISTKEKRKKVKVRRKKNENKENSNTVNVGNERKKAKESKINEQAANRVDKWIKTGEKEEWLRIKT